MFPLTHFCTYLCILFDLICISIFKWINGNNIIFFFTIIISKSCIWIDETACTVHILKRNCFSYLLSSHSSIFAVGTNCCQGCGVASWSCVRNSRWRASNTSSGTFADCRCLGSHRCGELITERMRFKSRSNAVNHLSLKVIVGSANTLKRAPLRSFRRTRL